MKAVVRCAALIALVCRSATAGKEAPLAANAVAQDAVVEQQERELSAAEAARAEARARLATAKGKSELAAAQWRKVVAHRESRLKAVKAMYVKGRICSPEPFQEALGAVAVARVRLADVEGKRDDLLAELPKVIAYYELRVRTYESLSERRAILEKEAQVALQEYHGELRWARERLAATRGDSPGSDESDNGDMP